MAGGARREVAARQRGWLDKRAGALHRGRPDRHPAAEVLITFRR